MNLNTSSKRMHLSNSNVQVKSKRNLMKTATAAVMLCAYSTVDSYSFKVSAGRHLKQYTNHQWDIEQQQKQNHHQCSFQQNWDDTISLTKSTGSLCNSLNSVPISYNTLFPTFASRGNYGGGSSTSLFMTRGDKSSYDALKGWSRSATVNDIDTSTSTATDVNGEFSKLGVRSRVKKILRKARSRTGIRNNSEDSLPTPIPPPKPPTPQSVIAEAASIGGLGGVVVDDKGTIDVALDYVRNETDAGAVNGRTAKATYMQTKPKTSKTAPASTSSPPVVKIEPGPEDRLRTSSATSLKSSSSPTAIKKKVQPSNSTTPISELDAFTGDVSAAFSLPPEPLPFTLPELTAGQRRLVDAGERVQFQSDMGREGSGFVVVDVKAPPDAVWDCLLDFESYPQTIPTVRSVDFRSKDVSVLKHGVPSTTQASFSLSKFRLQVAAIHKYRPHPQGDYMIFTLDPSCRNLVLQNAKGVWYTQKDVDGRKVSSFFSFLFYLIFLPCVPHIFIISLNFAIAF